MNLFERKTTICYCVPNGSSLCAPCRERRNIKPLPPIQQPIKPRWMEEEFKARDKLYGTFPPDPDADPVYPNLDLSKHEFPLKPEHFQLVEDDPCPNCGNHTLSIDHHIEGGCTCFLAAPCSYCTEQSLHCQNCDLLIEIPDA